jgi:hypothetical protein
MTRTKPPFATPGPAINRIELLEGDEDRNQNTIDGS